MGDFLVAHIFTRWHHDCGERLVCSGGRMLRFYMGFLAGSYRNDARKLEPSHCIF